MRQHPNLAKVMSLSCHSESLTYKARSFWVMRDIIRTVGPTASIGSVFLYELSSSVRNVVIWDIMMYKAFSNPTMEAIGRT